MTDKFFLDTNIIVYAHDDSEPIKKQAAQEVLFRGLRTGRGVISAQVSGEFFYTITRKVKKPLSIPEARHELRLLTFFESMDIDNEMVLRATHIMEQLQLGYRDSLILSSAERAGCRILYSEDFAHNRKYGEITVCNPFAKG